MNKRLLFILVFIFSLKTIQAQLAFNPFTQNIHFEPEPTALGFVCGSNTELVFTQGLTTSEDASQWETNPLMVTIEISGFELNGPIQDVVTGMYASHFNWSVVSQNPLKIKGIQNQILYGIGFDPLNLNVNASGQVRIALKVPTGLVNTTLLSGDVTLQVPAYMSTNNSLPDDQESIQTQSVCGASSCNIKPSIKAFPNAMICYGNDIELRVPKLPNVTLSWQFPFGANVSQITNLPNESIIRITNFNQLNNGKYIVHQTLAGCSQILSDSIDLKGGNIPVINFIETACNGSTQQVIINVPTSANYFYSMNGSEFQLNPILQGTQLQNFIVSIKEMNSNCVLIKEGLCNDCNQSVCNPEPSISIHGPKIACDGSLKLNATLSQANGLVWSSSGSGAFTQLSCNASSCETYYTPSVNDLNTGYVVISAVTEDPDGLGPCEPKSCSHLIKLINGLLQPNVISNSPICEGETLTIELPSHYPSAVLYNASGEGKAFKTQISIPNVSMALNGVFMLTFDVAGCNLLQQQLPIVILPPPNLNVQLLTHPEFCAGHGNGSLEVSINGGSGIYQAYLNPNDILQVTNGQLQIGFLAPGNYILTVIDLQCPSFKMPFPFMIETGTIIQAPIVSSQVSICEGEDLILSAQILSQQTAIWTKHQTPWQATGSQIVFSNVQTIHSGLYKVKAIDANGCASTQVSIQVSVMPNPVVELVEMDCYTTDNATVKISKLPNTEPLLYSFDGTTFTSSDSFLANTYGLDTLIIKSSSSQCISLEPIDIPNCNCPNYPQVSIRFPIVSCGLTPILFTTYFKNADSVYFESLGSGGFSMVYGLDSVNVIYTPTSLDLLQGKIQLVATTNDPDGLGKCKAGLKSIEILLRDSLPNIDILTSQQVYCTGDTMRLGLNFNECTTLWQGPNNIQSTQTSFTNNDITASDEGIYSVTISGNGCISKYDTMFIGIQSAPILNLSSTILPESCFGQSNGQVEINGNGGSGQVKIWSPTLGTLHEGGLPSNIKWIPTGLYEFKVAYLGCINSPESIILDFPQGLFVEPPTLVTYNQLACEGDDLAIQIIDPAEGDYNWYHVESNVYSNGPQLLLQNVSKDQEGLYQVRRNLNGCNSASLDLKVNIGSIPTLIRVDTTCGESFSSGKLAVKALVNENDTLEYSINNGPFQLDSTFDNLQNGLYQFSVRTKGTNCITYVKEIELTCGCQCEKINNLKLSPNPNQGQFILSAYAKETVTSAQLLLYDMLGKIHYKKELGEVSGFFSKSINIDGLSSGLYLVKLIIENESFVVSTQIN